MSPEYQLLRDLMRMYAINKPIWTPPEPMKPAPEPDEHVPTIDGSVIGYRAWRIQDWQLYGTGVNRAWVPGVNEATCDTGSPAGNQWGTWITDAPPANAHPAPAPDCHCGITALARFAEDDSHWMSADVFGAIEAWSDEPVTMAKPGDVAHAAGVEVKGASEHEDHGRFILHRNGFRAQYGKVVLLAVDPDWPAAKRAAVRALAGEHGADVCKRSHLEDAAKEHGQLISDELLKWVADGEPEEEVGGYFIPPTWIVNNQWTTLSQASIRFQKTVPPPPRKHARGKRTGGKKGVRQTLGNPGPPQGRLTKYAKDDRVRDSKGHVYVNVKAGKPGLWERESV